MAKASLTGSLKARDPETKVRHNDTPSLALMAIGDFRKATPGITESWRARAPIDPARCYLAVGFPPPDCAAAVKGAGVH